MKYDRDIWKTKKYQITEKIHGKNNHFLLHDSVDVLLPLFVIKYYK